MDDLESLSDSSDEGACSQPTRANRVDDGVYDRYPFDLRRDESLPIHDKREEIVDHIRANPVLVLEGDTGCGKTTQVRFFLMEADFHYIDKRKKTKFLQ